MIIFFQNVSEIFEFPEKDQFYYFVITKLKNDFFTLGNISIARLISLYFSLDCWVCTNILITITKSGPAQPTGCNCVQLLE